MSSWFLGFTTSILVGMSYQYTNKKRIVIIHYSIYTLSYANG